MARVIGIHEIALKPGVSAEEFEAFAREVGSWGPPGTKSYFVKGTRGARQGQYAVVMELESAERRDQLFPAEAALSEEARQYLESAIWRQLSQPWERLASSPGDPGVVYTDYEGPGGVINPLRPDTTPRNAPEAPVAVRV